MQRIVSLFDIHVPHQIDLDPIFSFIQDFKPTTIILGGDVHDFGAISHWVCDQSRHLDNGTVKQAYEEMDRLVIKPLSRVARTASKIYVTGNHENWLEKALQADPNLRGYIELEKNIREGWKILPYNVPYRAGSNLVYVHGTYQNKYHAHQTAMAYVGKSVIYGHVHSMQLYSNVSPIDSKHFYQAQSVGCLCHMNPSFMVNKPNAWVNGFNYTYLNDDGTFHPFSVIIVKNKFWAVGRYYK